MRLFAGIELNDEARSECAAATQRLSDAAFEARYERAINLHVTLAFLGNVAPEGLQAVKAVLRDTAGEVTPFDITLDMVGAFPNERRPRVLYVGSRNQGGAFRDLAHRLRKRYAQLNFTFDDDAIAHVTIARVKGGSSRPLPRIGVGPVSLRVAALTLFESVSEERGTRYAVLLRAPLAVTASGTRASNVTE